LNVAVDDSLAALDGLLAVQFAMGLPAEAASITLADSLVPPPDSSPAPTGEPLRIAAAGASLRFEDRNLALAHRSVIPAPSLQVGVERGDPADPAQGVLPTVGLALALPLFNRNGGEIGQARAARDRAQANLDLTRRESAADVARARRRFAAVLARLERDRRLLASADRVAAMSLQAYAERAIGTVTPRPGRFAELAAPGPTRVARILVVPGQRVAEGDTLIEFERAPFDAAAQSAATALETAQRTYARAVRLVQAGILPQKDSDQATSELAQAQVAAITARRAQQLATLRAPLSGRRTRMT